jgi:hypothetical protein
MSGAARNGAVEKARGSSARSTPSDDERAQEILERLWPAVQSTANMPAARWRAMNKPTALALVRAGVSADDVATAHEKLSTKRGYVVWTLSWVQEELARAESAESPRPPIGYVDVSTIR